MVTARHGRSMASVNQTRPHCVNQMGKTHSKHLAAYHGEGTARARHALCESAFTGYQQMAVDRKIKMAVSTDTKTHELVNSS